MTSSTIDIVQLWSYCLEKLSDEVAPQQFNTWISPLQCQEQNGALCLYAPNRFVIDWVNDHYLSRIDELLNEISPDNTPLIKFAIGSISEQSPLPKNRSSHKPSQPQPSHRQNTTASSQRQHTSSNINPNFNFVNFVEGKSNQLARAAALQVAENPGQAYNPLFLYGGVGLGKTHLAHAVGNMMMQQNPESKILYLHSERFVADMIKALQKNAMNEFKRFYRGMNCLLIDDIQFFRWKRPLTRRILSYI